MRFRSVLVCFLIPIATAAVGAAEVSSESDLESYIRSNYTKFEHQVPIAHRHRGVAESSADGFRAEVAGQVIARLPCPGRVDSQPLLVSLRTEGEELAGRRAF